MVKLVDLILQSNQGLMSLAVEGIRSMQPTFLGDPLSRFSIEVDLCARLL